MADGFIRLPDDSANTGKRTDADELTVGGNTVERQRMTTADPTTAAAVARVKNALPGLADYALAVRQVPSVDGWAVTHAPVVNTQATASKAAGGAGVRHVCTGVSFTLCGGTAAPAALTATVSLRDGATGAGTILASWTVALPAVAGEMRSVSLSGLEIPGTANTALTLEFSAASGANTFQSVNLFGKSVS